MEAAGEQAPLPPRLIPEGLDLLDANLCLTREDIIDDSQKTDTHVTNVNQNTLFQDSLTTLVTCRRTEPEPRTSLLDIFNEFINHNIVNYEIAGQTLYKISIPYYVKHIVEVRNKENIKKEILVRIMEELTKLEKDCAPFFFVKDNYGFKRIDEKFCLASFYDEGGRRITTGGRNLRDYLISIYQGVTTYTIDLTGTGMTSIAGSSLTAHWDDRGGGVTDLTEHQILFTLTIGGDYVQCVFTYNPTTGADRGVSYTNSIKTPISCSFFRLEDGHMSLFTTQFITACFSGNSGKNAWFNTYSNLNDDVHIKCGRFIQLGKAIGDASFVFSKGGLIENPPGKRYSVGTSDIALALRCCYNHTDVITYIPRGKGAKKRYYMSVQFPLQLITSPTQEQLQKKIVSNKKTKEKKNFQTNGGKKKVCKKVNEKLKKLKQLDKLKGLGPILPVGQVRKRNEIKSTITKPPLQRGQRGGDPNDPKTEFINYSIYYLANISYFFQDSLDYFSNLYTSFSKPIIDTDSTITYDGITYTISHDKFNLDVKILCISKVIDFLELLVSNTKKDEDDKLLRQLAEKITEKIVEKEEIFDIYKVFGNVPFGDTLLVPVPSSGDSKLKKLSGIPTTQLFEGCEKLLSYLDGVGGFTADFFKPIHDKIGELNEKTETGKKYTINTIFSDVDSEPITKASLKKVTDEELQPRPLPPYIQFFQMLILNL